LVPATYKKISERLNSPASKEKLPAKYLKYSKLVSDCLQYADHISDRRRSGRPGVLLPGNEKGKPRARQTFAERLEREVEAEVVTGDQVQSEDRRLHGKHQYSGTGIGLTIVKKIVEQHGGYISAESGVERGATFHIWLPEPH
jgi:hypothetical protein